MKLLEEFVKEQRKSVNLTQEEFAKRAGVTSILFITKIK